MSNLPRGYAKIVASRFKDVSVSTVYNVVAKRTNNVKVEIEIEKLKKEYERNLAELRAMKGL